MQILSVFLSIACWVIILYLLWALRKADKRADDLAGGVEEAWKLGLRTGVEICNLALAQAHNDGKIPERFDIDIDIARLSDPSATLAHEGDTHA